MTLFVRTYIYVARTPVVSAALCFGRTCARACTHISESISRRSRTHAQQRLGTHKHTLVVGIREHIRELQPRVSNAETRACLCRFVPQANGERIYKYIYKMYVYRHYVYTHSAVWYAPDLGSAKHCVYVRQLIKSRAWRLLPWIS